MAHNYYFFVAGLPDLLLDEGKLSTSCIDFAAEAQEQLSERAFNAIVAEESLADRLLSEISVPPDGAPVIVIGDGDPELVRQAREQVCGERIKSVKLSLSGAWRAHQSKGGALS